MKKILFMMVAALAFVACEKEQESPKEDLSILLYDNSGFVKLSQNSVIFDRQKGGTITIETEEDAFVAGIVKFSGSKYEAGDFYDLTPPDYLITLEQILKHKEFALDGCKVVPDGFRKFTVTVEPNSEYSQYNICFSKIIESKEHGKIAEHGGTTIPIVPK